MDSESDNLDWNALLPVQVQICARQWFNVAWRVLRDPDAAEDVCQEAILQACRHEQKWSTVESFRGWMRRVLVNEAIDELRRRSRDRRFKADATEVSEPSQRRSDEAWALREELVVAIEGLPSPMRQVLVMRLVAEHSGAEVAQMLALSEPTVSRRLHEGIEILRGRLAEWR